VQEAVNKLDAGARGYKHTNSRRKKGCITATGRVIVEWINSAAECIRCNQGVGQIDRRL